MLSNTTAAHASSYAGHRIPRTILVAPGLMLIWYVPWFGLTVEDDHPSFGGNRTRLEIVSLPTDDLPGVLVLKEPPVLFTTGFQEGLIAEALRSVHLHPLFRTLHPVIPDALLEPVRDTHDG